MRLKLVSLNTWNGGKLWEPMLAFLKKENPDILALQEVQYTYDPFITEPRFKTLDLLSPKLSLPHRMFAPAYSGIDAEMPLRAERGNGVLSRMTLIKAEHWFFTEAGYGMTGKDGEGDPSKYPRNLQYVLIQINDKKLHVFNTQGIWGTDNKDTPERLTMASFILEKIGDKQPAILCGDFNIDAGSQTIKNIGAKLKDVFAGDKRTTSFNLKQKAKGTHYNTSVVDFVFTTPDIKILEHRIPQVDVSDHMPLVVEFDF